MKQNFLGKWTMSLAMVLAVNTQEKLLGHSSHCYSTILSIHQELSLAESFCRICEFPIVDPTFSLVFLSNIWQMLFDAWISVSVVCIFQGYTLILFLLSVERDVFCACIMISVFSDTRTVPILLGDFAYAVHFVTGKKELGFFNLSSLYTYNHNCVCYFAAMHRISSSYL